MFPRKTSTQRILNPLHFQEMLLYAMPGVSNLDFLRRNEGLVSVCILVFNFVVSPTETITFAVMGCAVTLR